MSQGTRVVRLGHGVDRDEAPNEGTRVAGLPRDAPLDARAIFQAAHSRLARVVQEETRPGFFVFALGPGGAEVGRAWLNASAGLRAATIGRHGHADLHLPGATALSLRHCLMLVHLHQDRPVADVLDLDSHSGLQLEGGTPVGSVESDGPFFLHLPGLVLFFVPSGGELPWQPLVLNAFETLPRRQVVARPPLPGRARRAGHRAETVVHYGASPLDSRQLKALNEPVLGQLVLESHGVAQVLRVGVAALERGVVLGRYERCTGAELLSGDDQVSRVHACLVSRGDQLVLVDAGSSNGLIRDGRPVRCEALVSRATYRLSRHSTVRWEPLAGDA